MSYTPTTWTTGDTITAEKLNKIENGVVSASSSGNVACLFIQPSGWSSGNHTLGITGYFENINNKWVLMENWYSEVYWTDNTFSATEWWLIPPASANKKVFWAIYSPLLDDVDVMNLSGDISQTPITVYDGASSFVGYEITGIALAELIVY